MHINQIFSTLRSN
uniref:Uncharacterized protein n=1 Tax=Arundo donax TaxID=35708 RepID=A0A0A9E8A3_ARUDO